MGLRCRVLAVLGRQSLSLGWGGPCAVVDPETALGAWTAAAGRTSCVLKGRQNALFGSGGSERSIRTDLALSEGTIRCRIIDFFGLPSSDSAHFQWFVPKKLPEVAL